MLEAELYRLRGELELEIGRVGSGEAALTTAVTVAHRQQARVWELRATAPLARHWAKTERRRQLGICLLRFIAGSQKLWTLAISGERDPCSSSSIEIVPPHVSEERPVSLPGLRASLSALAKETQTA